MATTSSHPGHSFALQPTTNRDIEFIVKSLELSKPFLRGTDTLHVILISFVADQNFRNYDPYKKNKGILNPIHRDPTLTHCPNSLTQQGHACIVGRCRASRSALIQSDKAPIWNNCLLFFCAKGFWLYKDSLCLFHTSKNKDEASTPRPCSRSTPPKTVTCNFYIYNPDG